MQGIEISWSGDGQSRRDVHTRAAELIRKLCADYRGVVRASVHVQTNDVCLAKVPVYREERLFLVVFEVDFSIVLDIKYVTIREMIFMYDHDKVPHTALPDELMAIVVNL